MGDHYLLPSPLYYKFIDQTLEDSILAVSKPIFVNKRLSGRVWAVLWVSENVSLSFFILQFWNFAQQAA